MKILGINIASHDTSAALIVDGKLICAFRDPAILPSGNIAVCTGGNRWGVSGNIS